MARATKAQREARKAQREIALQELDEILEDFDFDLSEGIEDDAERDGDGPVRFNTSFFGADYPVDTLVQRMDRGDFFVPDFQRSYVWNQRQASRFIESLLYGLPVPGIFLYREPDTGKHLIIDGQQRLKTLQFFRKGLFQEKKFRLVDVAKPWRGRTYDDLVESDRRRLNDAVIHATVFKQEEPSEDDQSIYFVFERINTGGIRLSGQEIRACIYHGPLMYLLKQLNNDENWRALYGPASKRLKDQELILRFFAFSYDLPKYKRPMASFLNTFASTHRKLSDEFSAELTALFSNTMAFIGEAIGRSAFRPERTLNTAVFDAVSVGIARRLRKGPLLVTDAVKDAHARLLANPDFMRTYERATADEESVQTRMRLAIGAFDQLD